MKIGIVTIIDNNNYGNRLQNYAVQKTIEKYSIKTETLLNYYQINNFEKLKIKYYIKKILTYNENRKILNKNRIKYFNKFNKNISFSKKIVNINTLRNDNYNYYITGSDQVWNPLMCRFKDFDVLSFAKNEQKIAFSASFGVNEIPKERKKFAIKNLKTFKAISVREETGKKIVEELTGRKDIEVLLDPTMLLTKYEWQEVSKKPENMLEDNYILNYFLGELSEERKNKIYRLAESKGYKVINILDKDDPFYLSGPSEFLYLEKHAKLICTDSFHSCVFSILMDTPFMVFNREDKGVSMNSRLETLLSKFKLEDRYYKGELNELHLICDYLHCKEILKEERKKSDRFLRKALDIEGKEN